MLKLVDDVKTTLVETLENRNQQQKIEFERGEEEKKVEVVERRVY